ncbi:hypothetical protein JCM14076_23110 [Methylosoma difficile]
MKLQNTLLMSGLLVSGLLNVAHAADAKPCVQYALSAWLIDGKSPYQAFSKCASASVVSDPHITTFKGLAYDHNFPGDYTLMELQDNSGFSVVGRFIVDKANKVSAYTIPEAIKFTWPSHTAELHRGDEGAVLLIDGKVTVLQSNKTVKIGDVGYVSRKGASYFVANNVSDIAAVINSSTFYLDLNVTVPREADTQGLLGNPLNFSLFDRDGADLPVLTDTSDAELNKVSRADFSNYLESWRIANGNVFSSEIAPAIPDYNAKIYTLADIGKKRLERAQIQCEALEAAQEDRFNLNNCLFDMSLGGNKFARSAHHNQPAISRMEVSN